MEHQGICEKIFKIRTAMQDETSKILFDARLSYSLTRDKWQFYGAVDSVEKEWHCGILEQFLQKSTGKGIIVWGCGHDGREAKRVLDVCNYKLNYFCDSNSRKIGTKIDGILVVSVDDMVEKYRDYSVIIGSTEYKDEMNEVLLSHGFSPNNILYPPYGHLQAHTGKRQYFDVFEPEENEVFIDSGACDGGTILDFAFWTNGKYQKIYALEPLSDMCKHIVSLCHEQNLRHVEVKELAAWNREEKLFFTESEDKAGSKIEDEGDIVVTGMDIDSIVKDDKVTFIKMDIEGSERQALEGAKTIIQRDRPKLAISIYHKFEDIVELPAYILELVPDYKFYIRHYCSDLCETVLYATV